jgi:hypothetical protein
LKRFKKKKIQIIFISQSLETKHQALDFQDIEQQPAAEQGK